MINKRRVYLIKPKMQLRLTLWMVLVFALMSSCLAWLTISALTDNPNAALMTGDWLRQYEAQIRAALFSLVGLVLTSTLAMFFIGIFITQKIAGPLVPIERLVDDLIQGNYDREDVHLRQGDELQELATSLNRLKNSLRGGRPSAASDEG